MSLEEAVRIAREGRDAALADLFAALRIPSVSALPAHRADVEHNAGWLASYLDGLGLDTQLVRMDGGYPIVRADHRVDPAAPTLTIYGHYDVQPVDPLDEWLSPPFEPTVRDGRIWCRGASDNKGDHMAAIRALACVRAAGAPPLNVRVLLEGEEESNGDALGRYLGAAPEDLASDYVLLWDAGFNELGEPSIQTSVRGLVSVEIEATGAAVDLHSGRFGGIAPNPLQTLAHVLAALKTRDGRVTIPGFYDGIEDVSADEIASWGPQQSYVDSFASLMGVAPVPGEPGYSVLQRALARPTLDIHGIAGGFTGDGQKTVIPARANAKLSMRLVPGQDPRRIFDSLRAYLPTLSEPGVTLSLRSHGYARPAVFGAGHPGVTALAAGFEAAFGLTARRLRAGATLPVASHFAEALGARMMWSGIAHADDNVHAPNENLRVEHFHRGVETVIHFLHALPVAHAAEHR